MLALLFKSVSLSYGLCNSCTVSHCKSALRSLSVCQTFWSKDTDEGLDGNPFYAKYAEKILRLQSKDKNIFEERLNLVREKKLVKRQKEQQPKKVSHPSKEPLSFTNLTRTKELNSIAKLDELEKLSVEEISKLWKDYYKDKDAICATIPGPMYDKILERSLEYPMFLYAIFRKEGYEFVVGEFLGGNCYFTQLINYQAHKDNSPVCLTLTNFKELQEKKGIVLMLGEFNTNILTALEAQFLAHQVQLYYGIGDEKRLELLHTFNKNPNSFKHNDVIANIQEGASL